MKLTNSEYLTLGLFFGMASAILADSILTCLILLMFVMFIDLLSILDRRKNKNKTIKNFMVLEKTQRRNE